MIFEKCGICDGSFRPKFIYLPDFVPFTDSDNEIMHDDELELELVEERSPIKRGTKQFINERLVQALDRCKISDRYAVHILYATAEALGHPVEELILNRSSIRRCRENLREQKAKQIREEYKVIYKARGIN